MAGRALDRQAKPGRKLSKTCSRGIPEAPTGWTQDAVLRLPQRQWLMLCDPSYCATGMLLIWLYAWLMVLFAMIVVWGGGGVAASKRVWKRGEGGTAVKDTSLQLARGWARVQHGGRRLAEGERAGAESKRIVLLNAERRGACRARIQG
eukprot:1790-Chlamydomonas_euryale.AAC.1